VCECSNIVVCDLCVLAAQLAAQVGNESRSLLSIVACRTRFGRSLLALTCICDQTLTLYSITDHYLGVHACAGAAHAQGEIDAGSVGCRAHCETVRRGIIAVCFGVVGVGVGVNVVVVLLLLLFCC
jgi:hypothetical protein